ncbi:putative alkanal monooxygenase (luciferase), partial [Streptomyces himastatinicus ATCC 53653]
VPPTRSRRWPREHVSAGVVQIEDARPAATETLTKGDAGLVTPGPGRPCHGRRPGAPDARPGRLRGAAVRTASGGPAPAVRRPAGGHRRAHRHHTLRADGGGVGRSGRHGAERTPSRW